MGTALERTAAVVVAVGSMVQVRWGWTESTWKGAAVAREAWAVVRLVGPHKGWPCAVAAFGDARAHAG